MMIIVDKTDNENPNQKADSNDEEDHLGVQFANKMLEDPISDNRSSQTDYEHRNGKKSVEFFIVTLTAHSSYLVEYFC